MAVVPGRATGAANGGGFPPAGTRRARRREIVTVYGIGLFQGLSLVAFPAAATILTSSDGYDLSKSRYGLLFVPQVVMAIAGSLSIPTLARRFDLKHVLLVGVAADAAAMVLLVASDPLRSDPIAYPMLLVATASLGLGFGLTLSSISTYAGAFMPDRRDVALTALNVLLGLGTALSPLLIAVFLDVGAWWYLPAIAAAGLAVLVVVALVQPMVVPGTGSRHTGGRPPLLFWLFAAALVLYGIGETMFGNWGTTQLVGRGVGATSANTALAAFWASVTVGRLLIAVSAKWVHSTSIYVLLPWAIAGALVLVPMAKTATAGILVFAFGGLACSGFFPMTVGYGEATFPGFVELAAGWLIAAYQVGYGLAAFGGGSLQSVVSLATIFRIAAALAVIMAVVAIPIARRQRGVAALTARAS
ncbi:MAG TPA: MFS transporter [Acidimicrobiales bacterium]|nr:MFS transporter [Acidimicrobiales bacterium]